MRPVNTLHELCLATLKAVNDFYVAEDQPIPSRQVVSAGPPAWDCELVSVWCERTNPHSGDVMGNDPTPLVGSVGSTLRAASLVITICRCSPDVIEGDGYNGIVHPPEAEVTEAARLMHYDEPMMVEAIRQGASAGVLPNLNDWGLADWQIIGPMGGLVAAEMRFRVSTDWMPTGS